MTQIAGINIGIGVDLSRVADGLKRAEKAMDNFAAKLNSIRIEAAIKGDPFKSTKEYMNEASNKLQKVFEVWASGITSFDKALSKSAEKSRNSVEKIHEQLLRIVTVSNELGKVATKDFTEFKTKTGAQMQPMGAGFAKGSKSELSSWFDQEKIAKFEESLQAFAKEDVKANKAVKSFLKKLQSGVAIGKEEFDKELLKLFNSLKRRGKQLKTEAEDMGNEFRKAFRLQEKLKFGSEMVEAKSSVAALIRRKVAIKELLLEEQKLRTEMRLGIDVDKNKLALGNNLLTQQEKGIPLIYAQRRELEKYRKELNRRGDASSLFSPEWFKQRVRWFIQLRLFWGIYRNTLNEVKELIEFQTQLSRAMRTAESSTKTAIDLANLYSEAMRGIVSKHGVRWKEAGEMLYQLGSAGLTAEEALSALNSTMALVVGTEGDARETTKAVAGIYNNFKDTFVGLYTEAEKFQYINDLITVAWKNHQVEISELTEGYKRSIAMTKAAGTSLKDLTALLAVANDHMIKGGNAGRALTNVFMRMSRNTKAFEQMFGIKIPTNKYLNMIDIMRQLARRMGEGKMTVGDLSAAFERMGLRGAPIFVTLLQNWDKLESALLEFDDVSGKVWENEETRLKNVSGAWSQLLGSIRGFISEATPLLERFRLGTVALYQLFEAKRLMALAGKVSMGQVLPEAITPQDLIKMESLLRSVKKAVPRGPDVTVTLESAIAGIGQEIGNLWLNEITKGQDYLVDAIQKRKEAEWYQFAPYEAPPKVEQPGNIPTSELEETIAFRIKERLELSKIGELDEQIAKKRAEALELFKKKSTFTSYTAWQKEMKEYILPLITEIEKLEGRRERIANETTKQTIANLELQKNSIQSKIQGLKLEKDTLNIGQPSAKARTRIFDIDTEINKLTKDKAKLILNENILKKLTAKEALHLFGIEVGNANLEKAKSIELEKQKKLEMERRKLAEDLQVALIAGEEDLQRLRMMGAPKEAIFKAEEKALRTRMKYLQAEKNLLKGKAGEEGDLARLQINNKMRQVALTILESLEKQRQVGNILYDQTTKAISDLRNQLDILKEIEPLEKDRLNLYYDLRNQLQAIEAEAKVPIDIFGEAKTIEDVRKAIDEFKSIHIDPYSFFATIDPALVEKALAAIKVFERQLIVKEKEISILNEQLPLQERLIGLSKERYDIEHSLGDNALALLKNEEESVNAELAIAEAKLDGFLSSEQAIAILKEINDLELKRKDILEQQKRINFAIFDIEKILDKRIKDIARSWREVLVTTLETGLTNIGFNALGGFQEQRQEVANLEGDLAGLKQEMTELREKGLLSEDEAARFRELSAAIADTEGRINDLKDPIKNLKNAFIDLFKSIVDEIRKVIIQELALKAVRGVTSQLGSILPSIFGGITGGVTTKAQGGILPNIESFQSFSQGGMTGRPTLAMLGDNKSGREIVIPTENISKDKVSGYTRDRSDEKQPITIVNVLTEDDVAGVMAGAKGQRVVINLIGKDLRNRGPIYKAVRA